MNPTNFQQFANFIWSVADLLRGPYRPPQYERVILPLTGLRRFDWVLEPTKAAGRGKYIEFEPEPALKNFENIPLKEDIVDYVLREVRPYVADAWIDRDTLDEQDHGIGKVGYEINFNREFLQFQPPRPLAEVDRELAAVEQRIMDLLWEVTE